MWNSYLVIPARRRRRGQLVPGGGGHGADARGPGAKRARRSNAGPLRCRLNRAEDGGSWKLFPPTDGVNGTEGETSIRGVSNRCALWDCKPFFVESAQSHRVEWLASCELRKYTSDQLSSHNDFACDRRTNVESYDTAFFEDGGYALFSVRIMVMPKQHMVQKKNQKCMGAWTCQSVAEMRLIAQKPGVQNFVRKTTHVYSAKENDWGYSCFMTWADVLDESQGYIKDDRVTLEITVKAEAPKNMMSREDFRRSIDQWYNLAEMQLARGQVDLSIEANAQALKFCKDKDKQSQEKLEAQRERLVNHKLVESIHRIEKVKDVPKGTGDALRPTSLRQALTGAQKSATTSKATKVIKKERRNIVQQGKKSGSTLAVKNTERKSGDGDEDNTNSLSSEEAKQRTDKTEKTELKQNVETRKQRSRSLSDSDTMKIFSKKEMLTDQALLDDEEAAGDGNTTSPGSDEGKRLAEAVKMMMGTLQNLAIPQIRMPEMRRTRREEKGGHYGDLAHSEDDSSDYGENGIREMCGCGLHHHRDACRHSSISSLEPEDEDLDNENYEENITEHAVEMCENGCQTEDSGDIENPQLTALTATAAPVQETTPSLVTTSPPVQATMRERRHAGSGIAKESSLFRDNVAKMAESTEEVLQKIMQTREQQPQVEKISEADQQRLLQFCIKNFGIDNFVSFCSMFDECCAVLSWRCLGKIFKSCTLRNIVRRG
ncbi:MATH domain protein [Ancylostoma duodenale]|uniref:MATH domain protein n=1 Tax=Ancylostoma duodenale TaxID=51022 RepID=A0A0C2H1N9_9BILA|nr:MATH domain protein [Ancylostoma duodenale]